LNRARPVWPVSLQADRWATGAGLFSGHEHPHYQLWDGVAGYAGAFQGCDRTISWCASVHPSSEAFQFVLDPQLLPLQRRNAQFVPIRIGHFGLDIVLDLSFLVGQMTNLPFLHHAGTSSLSDHPQLTGVAHRSTGQTALRRGAPGQEIKPPTGLYVIPNRRLKAHLLATGKEW
jgi:hypothetical protein